MKRYTVLFLSMLFFLSACSDPVTPPVTPPASPELPAPNPAPLDPGQSYGVMEISFDGVGTRAMTSSAAMLEQTSGLSSQALSNVGTGFQIEFVNKGFFDTDASEVSDPDAACDYSNGARYLYATYEVRNAEFASGTPYTTSAENITFLAVDTDSASNGTNAIGNLKKFDGSDFASPAAVANCIKPTHGLSYAAVTGIQVESENADFQAFAESEIPNATSLGVDAVFPYGFVVRNQTSTTDRVLAANPGTSDFDGMITLAVRLPKAAVEADNPFRFSMWFMMLTDDVTRVTEGLAEAGETGATTRAQAFDPDAELAVLGESSTTTGPNGFSRICALRTAGTVGSPSAYLVNATTTVCDLTDPTVTLDDPGALTEASLVTLTGTASDNVAVTSVELYEDTTLLGTATLSAGNWTFDYTPAAAGSYTLKAVAYDANGNEAEASQSVTVEANVPNLSNLTAGDFHTCGIGSDNQAYCWGFNSKGQLGDGTATQRTTPTLVSLPSGVTSLSNLTGGENHTCGIGSDNQAYCWGFNNFGQIGDGTIIDKTTPTQVSLPSGVTSWSNLTGGQNHTCGIGSDSQAYCWGRNNNGQIGDGTTTDKNTPTLVSLPGVLTSLSNLTAGGVHTCGVGSDDQAYCWGANFAGAIGDGTTTQRNTPTLVIYPSP